MIELLCIDVDGTMSDGALHYGINNGEVREIAKSFNVKDGLALAYWNHIGRKVAIITGRRSEIVESRVRELGISLVFMGIKDKGACVRELKAKLGLDSTSCAAIGDDMNDISMFKEVSLSFAPKDCVNGIRNITDIILSSDGGKGAVREAIEIILKKEGNYEEFISYWQ